jgi:23S rRNA pseudouridine1911/1915/1917 synthase
MADYYEPLRYQVTAEEDGWKLRTILQTRMLISRQLLVKLKRVERGILLNGERKYVDFHVSNGDWVEVNMPVEQSEDILAQPIPLDIIHEDEQILVLNKQAGLIVHPTHGHYIHTIANGVVYHWQQKGIRCRFRPVHRLDQETSGVLLIAKTPFAHQFLALQLRAHTVKKQYYAFVHGQVVADRGFIDAPIDRSPDHPHRRMVIAGGAEARTHFQVIERFAQTTWVQLSLETGRTHQIRVHMSDSGHPLIGDSLYGTGDDQHWIARHALHAHTLGFTHPGTRDWMEFKAPLPTDLQTVLQTLRTTEEAPS